MIVDYLSLHDIREQHKDEIIGFASGSFDVTHAGHALFFEDCKRLCDVLVIMVGGDKAIRLLKGADRPILSQEVRVKAVDAFKAVDYTFLDYDGTSLEVIGQVFKVLRPDRYFINPDAYDKDYRMKLCNEHDVILHILDRECPKSFDKISTSSIIDKIRGESTMLERSRDDFE